MIMVVAMEHTIHIGGITDELLCQLDERARQTGVDRDSYVRKLIERAVAPPSVASSFSDLLAPIHDFTEIQGISHEEIERLFDEEVARSRLERRKTGKRAQ